MFSVSPNICYYLPLISYVAPGSVTHETRNEELVFEPIEMRRMLTIRLIDDEVAGEGVEVFNMLLTARPGQSVDTGVQNGLAQVLVIDDDQSKCN